MDTAYLEIKRAEDVITANLVSLQDYLEQRHGSAIAQMLIDDMVCREQVQEVAA